MNGLGIIDADLCIWAGSISTADLLAAPATLGHPTLKAKPGAVEPVEASWWDELICDINTWVSEHPILAGAAVAGGYLLLRRRR